MARDFHRAEPQLLLEDCVSTATTGSARGIPLVGYGIRRKGVLVGALTGGRKIKCACSSGDERSSAETCHTNKGRGEQHFTLVSSYVNSFFEGMVIFLLTGIRLVVLSSTV